jgi:cellobiose-specific phosphotransferase system component IIA
MNVNPLQLIQMIKSGNNPQQLLMNIIQQQGNGNPILQNAMNLANRGNTSALEQIARNIAQQKGINYDEAWNNFKQYLR